MRIESVNAHGFGPLSGQTLELAPGLTVVTGENESGKSSWHAATFAALCGRRRGRGRPTVAEQRFIDAHQPWSGGQWAVSCLLTLDDGRSIELRQDLSGRVDSRATDVALARDVSAEVMVEGSPDGSAWLGLTRSSFHSTACVGQAEILHVLDAADGLQDALQKAASTAGTSGTAATAIELLEECRRTAVGRDTATAVRPLRRARAAVAAGEERLQVSKAARAALTQTAAERGRLERDAEYLRSEAETVEREVAAASAALRRAEQRLVRPEAPLPAVEASGRRLRGGWLPGVAAVATLALLAAAVVMGSPALAGAGVVAGLIGAAVWLLPMRISSATASPTGGESAGPRLAMSPAPGRLTQLRLELAERQALAAGTRRRHHEAAVRAGRADAVLHEREGALPSTVEVEEELAAARRELARVEELDETLALAIDFLGRAQVRVHREVVPELTASIRDWLPRLTDGRYVDVRLDPASLLVEVCGPSRQFRTAQLLSHGTAEQIYLLLRVALAEQLTAGHDSCPLLLDDVTVHADPVRARQLLELLLELSERRQIVLFAHQDQVRDWAQSRLDGSRNRHVVLDPVRVS